MDSKLVPCAAAAMALSGAVFESRTAAAHTSETVSSVCVGHEASIAPSAARGTESGLPTDGRQTEGRQTEWSPPRTPIAAATTAVRWLSGTLRSTETAVSLAPLAPRDP